MEALTVGLLLKPRESTICWKEKYGEMPRDLPVRSGELLLLCDDRTKEIIPGLHTVRVLHPEYGTVTCILDELTPVNHPETYYS
jgi:hypothetical protein